MPNFLCCCFLIVICFCFEKALWIFLGVYSKFDSTMTERQAPREGSTGYTPASKKTRFLEEVEDEIEGFKAPAPRGMEELGAVLSGVMA